MKRDLSKKETVIILILCLICMVGVYLLFNLKTNTDKINSENSILHKKTITLDGNSTTYKFSIENDQRIDLKYNISIKNKNFKSLNYKLERDSNEVSNGVLLRDSNIINIDILSSKMSFDYTLKLDTSEDLNSLSDKSIELEVEGVHSNYYPYQITVTMPKNPQTERNFTWHTLFKDYGNELEIVEARDLNKASIDFSNIDGVKKYKSEVLKDENSMDYLNRVKVYKLKPGTKYFYRVGDSRKNLWSPVGEFKTDNGDDNFKFIFISDSQTEVKEEKQSTYAINVAKNTVKDYEFIVNAGDFVNKSCNKKQWKNNLNFSIYGDTSFITAVGNHDWNYGCESDYSFVNNFYYDLDDQNFETGAYYSLDYGNVHITVLNTNNEYYSKLNDKQYKWLMKDLKSTNAKNAKYRIVLMHRGLYTTGPHYYYHKDIQPLTKQLTSVMADGDVDLVLQGHDHVYSLTYPLDNSGTVTSVNYKDVYSNETNKSIKSMYQNKGPVYFIGDAIGPKHEAQLVKKDNGYVVDPNMDKDYTNKLDTKTVDEYFSKFQIRNTPYNKNNERYGIFSSIEIKGNDLIVNSYAVDNINYNEVKLYNSFAISK